MNALDSAAALLDRLDAAGLTVRVVGGTLRVGPPDCLTNELRTAIAAHREIIVSLIATAQPAPAFDTDLAVFTDADAGLDAHRLQEADALADELHHDGPEAIAAFRWLTRHPAPGYDRGDHLAAALAVRTAAGRGPPGPTHSDTPTRRPQTTGGCRP